MVRVAKRGGALGRAKDHTALSQVDTICTVGWREREREGERGRERERESTIGLNIQFYRQLSWAAKT